MSRIVLYPSAYGRSLLKLKYYQSFISDARSECTGTITTEQSDVSNLSKCLTAVRRFFTFLFSHIGLLALVGGYCILGGLTFEHLERENELQVKLNVSFRKWK